MKKFLSFFLAVLMVVGLIPTFLFTSAAEAAGETEQENQAFPELVITEIYSNSINYQDNIKAWQRDWPDEAGAYTLPTPGEKYFAARARLDKGTTLPAGTYEAVTDSSGKVTYTSVAGQESAGLETVYYVEANSSGQYDGFQFIEVYNSGTKPLNLYDYKLARDNSSTYSEIYEANSPIAFNGINPGPVQSSYHNGFEKVKLAVGDSLNGYYTKSGNSFVPCGAAETAQKSGTYYRKMAEGGEYFVVNPDEAILQPGQCAVLWFYTQIDNTCCAKPNHFRQFFEYTSSTNENQLKMDDVLILGIEANNSASSGGYNTTHEFKIALDGQWRYGIVEKDFNRLLDNFYKTMWISSVRWDGYAGMNINKSAVVANDIKPGSTDVTTGKYYYRDEVTGYYVRPTAGTAETIANYTASADEKGKALGHVIYYTLDLSKSNASPASGESPVSHRLDRTSANFLYGFDSSRSIRDGVAYTVSNFDQTPGFLTEVQKATLPCGTQETSKPDLVITEVVPNQAGGPDLYEYVEVVNTSGGVINIFDYTFLARSSSYMSNSSNEFFNKANPLIPGEYGDITAAEPGHVYKDVAPTNFSYQEGWLAPGETAILWSYFSDSAAAGATFDGFYDYYNLDRKVKVVAMDADGSTLTGHSSRQNLGNSGAYIYGLIANKDLEFYGDVYKSNPIFRPVVYTSGCQAPTNCGISIADCESFVLAAAIFATATNTGVLPEDYGYQYIWKEHQGLNNKCGALYAYAGMTRWGSATSFSFTGSVITEEWKASPGVLLPRQKTPMTTNTGKDRYLVYMQDYECLGTISGYNEVASLLNMTTTAVEGETDPRNLEIKDGKLYVTNGGTQTDYITLMSDAILSQFRKTNFTIEYSMTYEADSANGYSALLFNYDKASNSYAAPVIRFNGTAANRVVLNGATAAIEDATTEKGSVSMTAAGSLYQRLTNNAPEEGTTLGGVVMNVRIDVSNINGVTVYVNDQKVSETKSSATSEAFANWAFFLEESAGSDLVLATEPGVKASFDYIMVYSNTLHTNAADLDSAALFITEIMVSAGSAIYTAGSTNEDNLSWIKYIELTNGSADPVKLADYTLVRTAETSGVAYQHTGNNEKWTTALSLSDWLGNGTTPAQLALNATKAKNGDDCVKNPGADDAVLKPGESVILLFMQNGNQFVKKDANGADVDAISALRSWLNISDDTMVLYIGQAFKYLGTGTAARQNCTFTFTEANSYTYGVANKNVTYADGTEYVMKDADWKNIYTHDYRYMDCVVDHMISLAAGNSNESLAASDAGNGATIMSGYAAHFAYGLDNSMSYKYGVVLNRHNIPVMTSYVSGKTDVATKGEYNAGKLLALQQKYFEQLRDLRNYGYETGASLVITEYVPNTNDDRGGDKDAFEAIEITNIGTLPKNLYEYAITASPTVYGCPETWYVMDMLTPGPIVGKYHPWSDLLKNVKNPNTCIVQPGETVVVWVYFKDANNLLKVDPSREGLSIDDFRNYWAANGSPAMTEKDENGDYKVKVLATVAGDGIYPTFNLANSGTATLGICVKYAISSDKSCRGTDVISYATNPLYNMAWNLQKERVALTPNSFAKGELSMFTWNEDEVEKLDFGTVLFAGDSVSEYYTLVDGAYVKCEADAVAVQGTVYYEQVGETYQKLLFNDEIAVDNYCVNTGAGYEFATGKYARVYTLVTKEVGASVAGLYTQSEDGSYAPCAADATAVEGVQYFSYGDAEYYTLYYYANVQTVSNIPNMGYNFVYGNTITEGQLSGALISTTKVKSRKYNVDGKPFDKNEGFTPFVELDFIAQGARPATLGTLTEEQKVMLATMNFTEGTELADGTKLYLYKTVDDLSGSALQMLGATLIEGTTETTVQFKATLNAAFYEALQARYGIENVSVGILTARVETLMNFNANIRMSDLYNKYAPVNNLRALTALNGMYYKRYEPEYTLSASGSLAEVGVDYYAKNTSGEYEKLENVVYGDYLDGYYVDDIEHRYDSKRPVVLAEAGVEYFKPEGDGYVKVDNVVTGQTDVYYYFTRTQEFNYVPCADSDLVLEDVKYYILEGGKYVLDYAMVGDSAMGLFVREYYYEYHDCREDAKAQSGVDYYVLVDGEYILATDVVVGVTDLEHYYTQRDVTIYVPCDPTEIAQAGTTYFAFENGEYVEKTLATPEDVSTYYTMEIVPVFYPCAADAYAEVDEVYYTKAADGNYYASYNTKAASSVAGYYVLNGENEYVACDAEDIAVAGVTYYALVEENYVPVDGLVTVDNARGYYTLEGDVYTLCEEDRAVLSNVTYYTLIISQVDADLVGEQLSATEGADALLTFVSSEITMAPGYYRDTFVSIAYIKIVVEGMEIYVYADAPINRSVVQISSAVMMDYSDVQTAVYCYEVGDGTYSRYTASQRARFAQMAEE